MFHLSFFETNRFKLVSWMAESTISSFWDLNYCSSRPLRWPSRLVNIHNTRFYWSVWKKTKTFPIFSLYVVSLFPNFFPPSFPLILTDSSLKLGENLSRKMSFCKENWLGIQCSFAMGKSVVGLFLGYAIFSNMEFIIQDDWVLFSNS